MNKREYERLLATMTALQNEKGIMWEEYFKDKIVTINDEQKELLEVMKQIQKAATYEDLGKEYKVYDNWVDTVNKAVGDMKAVVDFSNVKQQEMTEMTEMSDMTKTTEAVDKSFFGRMAKELATAKAKAWKNSDSFDKMEKALADVNKIINGEVTLADGETKEQKLFDALEALEMTADNYLEHKVKDGANEKAVAKINAATSMKDYIKERKTEILRKQLVSEVEKGVEAKKADREISNYDKKAVEIASTRDHIHKICEKNNLSADKIKKIEEVFFNADVVTYYGNINFSKTSLESNKANLKNCATSFVIADFMRNELFMGGGDVTPMMKQFFDDPEAFVRTFAESGAISALYDVEDGFDKKNVGKFAAQSSQQNVVEAYERSKFVLCNDKLFDACLSANSYAIQEEKEALEKQKVEAAEKEKVKLEELKKQEKAKEIKEKYEENRKQAQAFAGLAKFAKERIGGEKGAKLAEEYLKISKDYSIRAMFGDDALDEKEEKEAKKTEKVQSKAVAKTKGL